jgi:signal transduction histidine kinase
MKEYANALQSAQTGLAIAKSINLKDQLRDCNETLSKIYKAMGSHRMALQHFEVFKLYADSINSSEIEKRTANLEAEYEFDKRESQLKAEQDERNSEYERQRLQQRWIIFSILIGLTLVSVFAILLYNSRKKIQRAFLKLEEANQNARSKSEALRKSNEELQVQKEEIATQRDLVGEQNRKLHEASHIIEEQNEEIKRRIENLESEVENRTRELLEYNQRLEQFAFITAHNLRAPVATILGLGNVLDLANENPDEKKLIYDKLIFTTKELDRVVRDLNSILDIRKNSTTVLSNIDLDVEVEQLCANLDKEIKDTNAKIECDFSDVKVVNAVKPYLDSILSNLVGNAIKYRHPSRAPHIFLTAQQNGNGICITIADNGIGIDLKLHREKLFTLYSRFHTHVDGKGLGLHMVKTQLAAMGGTIEIESEVEKGTTFFVYLPVKK